MSDYIISAVLASIGLALFVYGIKTQILPYLNLRKPNATTREAMEELDCANVKSPRFASVDELMVDLNSPVRVGLAHEMPAEALRAFEAAASSPHASDCSLHNPPALKAGDCDCRANN